MTLNASPSAQIALGDEYMPSIGGTWTGKNLGSSSVYLQVSDSGNVFTTPPVGTAPSDNHYWYELPLSPKLAVGTYSGTITVRACEDVQCIKPYAGAMQTSAYTFTISPVPEWETLQGNAAHNGYVPIRLNPARFARAWEWRRPTTGVLGFINSVVTYEGKVFVTEDEYAGSPYLYALSETNGAVLWKQQFTAGGPALSPPAVSDGRVYAATTGHSATFLWGFDVDDGTPLLQTQFSTQWANLLAPTVWNGRAYVGSGYYGGIIYAYAANDGMPLWTGNGGTYGMNTPAADDRYVYAHNGSSLNVLDAATGTPVATIGPNNAGVMIDYHASPILGSEDNVIAYSGGASSGRASSSTESSQSRPLQNFSVKDRAIRWTTVKTYKTYPAVAKGVVYVASNNPKSLDAIDEKTGAVLWSWVPGPSDITFHRNVVVTSNLVFVSTNRAVYALDLATRKPVWESTTPGALSISASRTLYIATGTRESDARLVAFRLK